MDYFRQLKTRGRELLAFSTALDRLWLVCFLALSLLLIVFFFLPTPAGQRQQHSDIQKQPPDAKNSPHRGRRIAIVIDDIGYSEASAQPFIRMPAGITFAVIPTAPFATKLARMAHQHGHQVIIHMPMEPLQHQNGSLDLLTDDMTAAEMQQQLSAALVATPYATGLNNHMGSRFTVSNAALARFLPLLREQELFVLDSRTNPSSQFGLMAATQAIPSLSRDVFLDNVRKPEAITQQLEKLLAVARKKGKAVGIGHPYAETAAALQQFLKQHNENIEELVVPLSQILFN